MADPQVVKGVNVAIKSGVGLVYMNRRVANDNAPIATAAEMNNIKSTALSIVKYLVSIDASLKAQVQSNMFMYNQSSKQEREDIVEQYRGFGNEEAAVMNDAVPVVQEASSSISGMAAALTAGAAALAFAGYKLYDMLEGSISNAMGSLGAMTGLGETPQPEPEPEKEVAPPAPVRPAPAPKQETPRSNVKPSSETRPGASRVASAMPAAANAAPAAAAPSSAPPAARSSAPPPVNPPKTPEAPPADPKAPKDAKEQEKPPIAAGEIPKNDIVALGNYLIGKGAEKSKMEHTALSGRVGDHSENSRHYKGMAIDVNFPGPNEAAILDELEPLLVAAGYNTIWRKPDHYTHMHVSVGGPEGYGGGDSRGGLLSALSSTFEDAKAAFSEISDELRGKMRLMKQLDASDNKARPISPEMSIVQHLKRAAAEKESDMLMNARRSNITRTTTNKTPPVVMEAPVSYSTKDRSASIVNRYFLRMLGTEIAAV